MILTMTIVLCLAALIATPYLVYQNYQLEKRWRNLRYCWQTMSDFAGERLRDDVGFDHQWKQVLDEQVALMKSFGTEVLSPGAMQQYEAALIDTDMPALIKHR